MVKKKGKSKRTTLKDKYKIQRRVVETHRKQRKQAKRDAAAGIVRHDNKKKKDPGIPNSWPFKQDLLKDIQRARERQIDQQNTQKEKRKNELKLLRDHQASGGTARTVQELMDMATAKQNAFEHKQLNNTTSTTNNEKERSDGSVGLGQQSRRAYLRELKKVVDTADIILQVLDARDPIATRMNHIMEDTILSRSDKRMVLVLNKIDLVPKHVISAWLIALRRSHPTIAIKASNNISNNNNTDDTNTETASALSTSTNPIGMDGLLQLLKNYARTGGTGGKNKTTIVVGVVGYPNVGKSSIINALKRTRAVGVSPRPGFTTSMQEVVLDRNVRLLDSPGVVFDDKSAALGNCVDPDTMDDPIPPVSAILHRCNHKSLLMTYNIPNFPEGDVMMFLALVAKSYGRVLKGGIPNKVAAARAVLKDWNNGKIPFFTIPPKDTYEPVKGTAVVVQNFGKEFDIEKYDDTVLQTLKDTDEIDYVQLEESKSATMMMETDDTTAQEVAKMFANNNANDSDDDDEDMDDVDETAAAAKARAKLAQADDYDFDDM